MQQEALLESVELRNKYVSREHVLDKIKLLTLLPDNKHLTTKMVADYFVVGEEVINMTVKRHRDELKSDGLEIYSGDKLVYIKYTCEMKSNKARKMILYNRRCVLRIGMLLRDSEVAKALRTYLLNIEEQSTQQQKAVITRGSKWDGKDLILYDRIVVGISEGKTLTQICDEVSSLLNESSAACRNRYTQNIKKKISNSELIKRIESNKRKKSKYNIVSDFTDSIPTEGDGIRVPTWQELYLNEVVQMNIETNELVKKLVNDSVEILTKQIENKEVEIKNLRSRNKKLSDELKQVQAVVASAIKVGVNETLQQTFRMSPSGNLERI